MNNSDDLFSIKKGMNDTIFGHGKKSFLLIDATLENYDSEPGLFEELKKHNVYPIKFSHPELVGALPLFLVELDEQVVSSQKLFEISICSALKALRPENLKQGKGRCVCGWLTSPLTIEQLSRFISNSAIQHIQGVGDILLRFFDPSVLRPLLEILDPWQQQRLLDNIDVWFYLDGNGILQSVNGEGKSKKLSFSLGLVEKNLRDIQNIEVTNKILLEYRAKEQNIIIPEIQAIRLLRPALRFFSIHFMIEENDIFQFGVDVLTSKHEFYLSPDFSKHLPHDNSKKKYKDIKMAIGDNQWSCMLSSQSSS
ncbi:DUF4123 domain-containing protein [Citrobacter farmeri]|uniref:DUF4123 domain-containing protein n=1 Tax=Citrobacter farmeri TaxID=67824 RepID=UPI00388F6901|nr:DUF4123 domain-containing protein [Citrobacter farmeri]